MTTAELWGMEKKALFDIIEKKIFSVTLPIISIRSLRRVSSLLGLIQAGTTQEKDFSFLESSNHLIQNGMQDTKNPESISFEYNW